MRCTPNELLALLKRALRSVPGQRVDGDAIARNVVELECRGLHGLAALLAQFHDDPAQEDQQAIIIAGEERVRVAGGSLLLWAPQIIDHARCRAELVPRVTLYTDSSRDPFGLLPELLRAERDRWHAEMSWTERDGGRRCVLRLEAGAMDPWYGRAIAAEARPETPGSRLSLTLAAADDGKRQAESAGIEWLVTPDEFARRRAEALVQGLDIDDYEWLSLGHHADQVLVESSDQSRQGAGE